MREKEMRGELLVCKERRFWKAGRAGKGNKGSQGGGGVEDGLPLPRALTPKETSGGYREQIVSPLIRAGGHEVAGFY